MARGRGLQVGSINILPLPSFQPNCKKMPFNLQKKLFIGLKNGVTRFIASGFFHESSSPRPLKMTLGSFRKFKMHHRYQQRHWWQICRLCQLHTRGKCLTEGCAYERKGLNVGWFHHWCSPPRSKLYLFPALHSSVQLCPRDICKIAQD